MRSLTIYDFDKTVYNGDCSLDFYLFCIRKQPLLLRYLPTQLWHAFLFVGKFESRTDFKSHFFVFLRSLSNVTGLVDRFWDAHYRNIKPWYGKLDHANDVIVSASPEFLLQPAAAKLKVLALIATRMNPKTGMIDGENCRGQEKVVRLRQHMGDPDIAKVYSDSMSDLPLLALAKEKYIVRHQKIMTLKNYQNLSPLRRWFL